MALNIEGATIGFDSNNVEKALSNLNTSVIQEAIKTMNSSMSKLRDSVDEAWVGASAEQFKANMESDKDRITTALQETYDVLKSEMYQIVNEMADADAALVERRGE